MPAVSCLRIQRFSQPAADLIEDQPDQRLGATDVRGRNKKVERDRLVGADKIGDAPVAAFGVSAHDRIAVEPKKAHGRRQNTRALVFGLVEELPRRRGNDGVHLWLSLRPKVTSMIRSVFSKD